MFITDSYTLEKQIASLRCQWVTEFTCHTSEGLQNLTKLRAINLLFTLLKFISHYDYIFYTTQPVASRWTPFDQIAKQTV